MKQIAIIPARGGSKRLPRKNILPVNGKPMLSYSIEIAQDSGLFDEVLVSTEDHEIAGVAESAGATVVHRPGELAQDRSTVVQVCSHVLSLSEYSQVKVFCCIYATAILLEPKDLIDSRELLGNASRADFVMGVSHYNYHPVQALTDKDGYLCQMWPEYQDVQSQFYPELVVSNGTFYWAMKDAFLESLTFYGNRLKGYVVPHGRAVDIDTPEDYKNLERLVQARL